MKKKYYTRKNNLYKELIDRDNLLEAWDSVFSNIQKSENEETVEAGREYKKKEFFNIKKISQKLSARKFKFITHATPIKKKDGDYRPVVNISFDGRIVQRCILNILVKHKKISKYLKCPYSFGAIEEKGVDRAVEAICRKAKENGYNYAITADIKSFYTEIKRKKIIELIKSFCEDEEFLQIIDDSINLKVMNLSKYPKKITELYDYSIKGVPQGSCLSPLFGNMYLYDFDIAMNKNANSYCVRYIDDIALIGKSYKSTNNIFNNKMLPFLEAMELQTHDIGSRKLSKGYIKSGFNYLGVTITDKVIRPTNEAVNSIKKEIDDLLNNAMNDGAKKKTTLYKTLDLVSKKIKGWGHTYYFCNAGREINNFDIDIDNSISKFITDYNKKLLKLSNIEMRNKLGVTRALYCKPRDESKIPIMHKLKKEVSVSNKKQEAKKEHFFEEVTIDNDEAPF